ncbi:MAG: hypothetical protein M1837_001080 [Sclerophora amabilis]|nr:MAG: hypothetical protein M1837_001080 [Sclerophora amabilis]
MTIESSKISGGSSISGPFIASSSCQKRSLAESLARNLCAWNRASSPPETSTAPKTIAIVCVSDTHDTKPTLPDGDILLHAGDLSQYGLHDEIQAQLDWLNEQPHKHKIVIAGNHDLILDQSFVGDHPDRDLDRPGKSRNDLQWGDVKYLLNNCAELDCGSRTLKVYGSPLTPRCGNFAFQHDPSDDVWAATVPEDADILLTHGPPALHLDQEKGCPHLLRELWRVQPKLMVFGHIHDGRGEELMAFGASRTCYEKIALGVWPWVNFFKLILIISWQAMHRSSRISPQRSTHLVNAAVVAGRGNCETREPIVIHI